MEQYIYLLQPRRLAMLTEGPTDEEAQALAGHVAYLERLSGQGDVLLAAITIGAGGHFADQLPIAPNARHVGGIKLPTLNNQGNETAC